LKLRSPASLELSHSLSAVLEFAKASNEGREKVPASVVTPAPVSTQTKAKEARMSTAVDQTVETVAEMEAVIDHANEKRNGAEPVVTAQRDGLALFCFRESLIAWLTCSVRKNRRA
jgi:hypothetical protein